MPLFNNTLWRTATIFSKKATFENENEKSISDELIYKAMTKLNMTTELLVTGGFRVPNVQKSWFEIIMKQTKVLTCSFTNFISSYNRLCCINLVEGEANETPTDTIFIHEVSYQENLHVLLQFQKILYCHSYKFNVCRMKECDRFHNWFHEVCKRF